MKIAMLSPIAWRTPPRHYGPWEQVVSLLTEGLVQRGVDVTLFATADSITSGRLVSVSPRGYEEDPEILPKVWECLHIAEVFEQGDRFDLIHNHFDFLPLTYTGMTETPVVTTIHGFSSPKILPVYRKYNGRTHYVAISEADKSPELDYIATIHHGIDLSEFTFRPDPGDYLLFFGRIHHEKGARECIEVARRTGMKLVMAGIIQDREYFERQVKPYLDGRRISYVGSAGPERRNALLGGACALLHPINFDEPFGLSVVEAMACGTPVIAVNRGSMPEIIAHGETGFLVRDREEMAEAVSKVKGLDRRRCRRWVEERFSAERMVQDYLRVYEEVVRRRQGGSRQPWGFDEVLSERPDHRVRRITVHPGRCLIRGRDEGRWLQWCLVRGRAVTTREGQEVELGPGRTLELPPGTQQHLRNPGPGDLVLIEVQAAG